MFWVVTLQALPAQMVLLSREDDTCSPGVAKDKASLCEFILRAAWPSAVFTHDEAKSGDNRAPRRIEMKGGTEVWMFSLSVASCCQQNSALCFYVDLDNDIIKLIMQQAAKLSSHCQDVIIPLCHEPCLALKSITGLFQGDDQETQGLQLHSTLWKTSCFYL